MAESVHPLLSISTRFLPLDGPCNCRSLNGIPVADSERIIKDNVLFRSDELSCLSDRDWKLLKEAGLGVVFDLRRRDEKEAYETKVPEGMNVELKWWNYDDEALKSMAGQVEQIRQALSPLADMDDAQIDEWMKGMYKRYAEGPYLIQKQMKEIIEQLGCPKEEFQPALIHCGAGKDRTAFTVAVILKLLGVSDDSVLDDYELTTEAFRLRMPTREHLRPLLEANGLDGLPQRVLEKMMECHRAAMEGVLAKIKADHGNVTNFACNALGIEEEVLDRLRENLLQ